MAYSFVDADSDSYTTGGLFGGVHAVSASLTGLAVGDLVFAVRVYTQVLGFNGFDEDPVADEGFAETFPSPLNGFNINSGTELETWYRVVELADAGTISFTQTTTAGGGFWTQIGVFLVAYRGLQLVDGAFLLVDAANGISTNTDPADVTGALWEGVLWYYPGDSPSDVDSADDDLQTDFGVAMYGGTDTPLVFQSIELDGSAVLPVRTADGTNAGSQTRSLVFVITTGEVEPPQEAGPAFEFVSLRVNFRQLPHEVTSRMLDDFKKER